MYGRFPNIKRSPPSGPFLQWNAARWWLWSYERRLKRGRHRGAGDQRVRSWQMPKDTERFFFRIVFGYSEARNMYQTRECGFMIFMEWADLVKTCQLWWIFRNQSKASCESQGRCAIPERENNCASPRTSSVLFHRIYLDCWVIAPSGKFWRSHRRRVSTV